MTAPAAPRVVVAADAAVYRGPRSGPSSEGGDIAFGHALSGVRVQRVQKVQRVQRGRYRLAGDEYEDSVTGFTFV